MQPMFEYYSSMLVYFCLILKYFKIVKHVMSS